MQGDTDAERVMALYQRHAIQWDSDRDRSLFERPWLDRFLALTPPEASILDLGCGSGEPIARYFIGKGCRVTGIDSSRAFIGICRERFPSSDWHLSDMRELALGRLFDGVLAWDSFFHLTPEDQRRTFPVFRRHAAPKSALLFTSGPGYGSRIGSYQGEPLYHGSLDAGEYRRHGFEVISNVVETPPVDTAQSGWLAFDETREDSVVLGYLQLQQDTDESSERSF